MILRIQLLNIFQVHFNGLDVKRKNFVNICSLLCFQIFKPFLFRIDFLSQPLEKIFNMDKSFFYFFTTQFFSSKYFRFMTRKRFLISRLKFRMALPNNYNMKIRIELVILILTAYLTAKECNIFIINIEKMALINSFVSPSMNKIWRFFFLPMRKMRRLTLIRILILARNVYSKS